MRYLIPQGIGDVIWALLKVEDINRQLRGGSIDIRIASIDPNYAPECRALDFVTRFSFVNSAEMYAMPRLGQTGAVLLPGEVADENGYYRYIADGASELPGIDFVLMPNAALERGIRLENWLPQFAVNWDVMEQFKFLPGEDDEANELPKPFVVFFCGGLDGNTIAGHNRNGIWKPEDWVELGERLMDRFGVSIVVVGGDADRSYYDEKIVPVLKRPWVDCIGDRSIGQSYAIIRQARFMISYQSGMGIVSNYFGVPVGIFWRARGDSISPYSYVSFQESMASAWADPAMISSGRHMPLIYGRHDVNYIMSEIDHRKW